MWANLAPIRSLGYKEQEGMLLSKKYFTTLVQSSRAHLMQQIALGPALPPERETTWVGGREEGGIPRRERQVRNGRICVLLHEEKRRRDVGNYLQQEFAVVRSPGERMPIQWASIYDVRKL